MTVLTEHRKIVEKPFAMQKPSIQVADHAEYAAAQYAPIRGHGFERHLRITVYEEGGLWRGDAVYTISLAAARQQHNRHRGDSVELCGNRHTDGVRTHD